MRQYAPYFDSETETWKVICIDDDGYWFNYVVNAGNQENAKEISSAMNNRKFKDHT